MKIVIVGCGKIGSAFVSSLIKEGHDVVAVDSDNDVITQITNIYDAMAVCGNGADSDTLFEAGVENSELFIATTGSDELNMLSCFLAKKMGAKHTVARIRNPEYNDNSLSFMKQHLELSMVINPELLAAQELYNILKLPSAAKVEFFSHRNFEIVELKLKQDSQLDGLSLAEFRKNYKLHLLICVVQRGEEVYIPDGNFVLKSGDKIGVAATKAEVLKFLKMTDANKRSSKNVMIMGASKTAFYLSNMLISSGSNVKVVEIDRDRCVAFAEIVPEAVVICGDCAHQELLMEEGITSVDAFVSLTGMDEENLLVSMFASSMNVPKVISKVNRKEFLSTAERLGIDSIITPKKIISDSIVRYARALHNSLGSNVETLYNLMDGKAEALEFNVSADCKLNKILLKDLELKDNILIAGIIRGRKIIVPTGVDYIQAVDKVIIITTERGLSDLSDIVR